MDYMEIQGASLTLPLHALVEPSRVPGAESLVTKETQAMAIRREMETRF